MRKILGINCDHADAAACIISGDKIIVAIEEERLSRTKHHFGFPYKSIFYCLKKANLDLSDIDIVAINSRPNSNLKEKIKFVLKNPVSLKLALKKILRKKNISQKKILNKLGFHKKIEFVDHHLSHILSSYSISKFQNSVVLSVDGFGDFASVAWGQVIDKKIIIEKKVLFPNSIGIFYSAVTQHLGFENYGDEFKVMGMASYGSETYVNELKKLISFSNDGEIKLNMKYFNHHKIDYFKVKNNTVIINDLFNDKVFSLIGKKRQPNNEILQKHYDLACSLQKVFEEYVINLINFLKKKYPNQENICLAGGCLNNSLANGKISLSKIFKKVFVCPSPGDSGGAIGAAIKCSEIDNFDFDGYSGLEFSNKEIFEIIQKYKDILKKNKISYVKLNDEEIIEKTAEQINFNKVVGWFSGKMEFGPRALGNRSILCNPSMTNARSLLNEKIKLREKFRPFAGSIIQKYKNDWFECPEEENSPFMSKVYKVKDEKKKNISSIVHADGTCRIQTVKKNKNSKFYELINSFYLKSNIPIILNTSFNENEPIVCTPDEALDCFVRTKMDNLILENYFFYRNEN